MGGGAKLVLYTTCRGGARVGCMGGGLSQCYTHPAGGGGQEQGVWGGGLSQCYRHPAGGRGKSRV